MEYKNKLSIYFTFLKINIVFAILIAIRYFFFLPELPTDVIGVSFIVFSLVGQMSLLGTIVGVLCVIFVIAPKRIFYFLVSFFASFSLCLLVIDTFVFSQYRFHINEVVLKLVLSGDVVDFSASSLFFSLLFFLLIILFEYKLCFFIENRKKIEKVKNKYKPLTMLFVFSFFVSNFIHVWAAANAYQPVMMVKNYLPLFQPATANGFMQKHGWIDEKALAKQRSLSLKISSDLAYPVDKLAFSTVDKPVNIMFLVIDSWRFDTFNAENTPNLWNAAQEGLVFNNHMSTGNSTRTGIFGLFYGIPGTYWQSVLSNQRSPVFLDRLQNLGYDIGVFASASLMDPEFNRTVFSQVGDLRLRSHGNSPSERDASLTKDWLEWYKNRDTSKPAFSFLFYDAPHGYDFPDDYTKQYQPMLNSVNYLTFHNDMDPLPFLNRYKTSVKYVDDLAKTVLDELKKSGDAANTLLVITGDHGQEFNDNKLNYWGHNSNFTSAQVKVPFAIIGPGLNAKTPNIDNYLSSHVDVVPTIMQNYLGIKSPLVHYTTGINLLDEHEKERDWLIASSYAAYAMITRDSILEVGASGQYQYLDSSNRAKKDEEPNFSHLKTILEELSRFKAK